GSAPIALPSPRAQPVARSATTATTASAPPVFTHLIAGASPLSVPSLTTYTRRNTSIRAIPVYRSSTPPVPWRRDDHARPAPHPRPDLLRQTRTPAYPPPGGARPAAAGLRRRRPRRAARPRRAVRPARPAGAGDRVRHGRRHRRDGRGRPRPGLPRRRGPRPRRRQPAAADRGAGPDQPPGRPRRRPGAARTADRPRQPGRHPRVLPRPVA